MVACLIESFDRAPQDGVSQCHRLRFDSWKPNKGPMNQAPVKFEGPPSQLPAPAGQQACSANANSHNAGWAGPQIAHHAIAGLQKSSHHRISQKFCGETRDTFSKSLAVPRLKDSRIIKCRKYMASGASNLHCFPPSTAGKQWHEEVSDIPTVFDTQVLSCPAADQS